MGIYNRDYYRDRDTSGSFGDWGLQMTPVVKWIIVVKVAVFLLQIFVVREVQMSPRDMLRAYNPKLDRQLSECENDPQALAELKKKHPEIDAFLSDKNRHFGEGLTQRVSVVQQWFEHVTDKVIYEGQVWRLLTAAFCHQRTAIWHIVFNMLGLYWFGCTLEAMYGSREFLLFYLTSAVVASLTSVGLDLYTASSVPAIGASGAVMAVMMVYTVHFPTTIIRVCWIIPIEMRWLMAIYVIWDLHPVLLALAGDHLYTGIGHAAHLGGLAFGFFYAKYQWRIEALGEWLPAFRWRTKSRPRLRLVAAEFAADEPDTDASRVDQLLAKIYESGQSSLTEEEHAVLRKASERIKNRSHSGG